jgi:hypothetical protein
MALIDTANLARDADFRERIAAAAAAYDLDLHPTAWADQHQWTIAAVEEVAAAYAYAIAVGVERPGLDPSVITDAQIVEAVQGLMAADAPTTLPEFVGGSTEAGTG